MAYGLLHLPRMPELRGHEIITLSDVNPDMIPYKCVRLFCCCGDSSTPYRDKVRERHRKQKLSQLQEKREGLPAAKRRKVWINIANVLAVLTTSSHTT